MTTASRLDQTAVSTPPHCHIGNPSWIQYLLMSIVINLEDGIADRVLEDIGHDSKRWFSFFGCWGLAQSERPETLPHFMCRADEKEWL
ncbi:unnamed protein product [Protopolystoma xenopodis]|uniref:Uncharacterized protein n=1 Tax=Protopolystoma xenopodis TaxID=117903 RepID=A0A3S5BXM2_9PLAT|nr:unnamed protein product [Protopolystoma xenopodis]